MSQYTQTSGPRMNVESFNLDHTRVAAPFVRVADRKRLPGGDERREIGRASCRERV